MITTRYNVIKEPIVGDGPTRLIGTFVNRAEADAVAQEESAKQENRAYRVYVEADPPE